MAQNDMMSGIDIPTIHNSITLLTQSYGQLLNEQMRQIQFLQAQVAGLQAQLKAASTKAE